MVGFHEVFQRIAPGLAYFTIHHHGPGLGFKAAGIGCRIALVGAELIEVVVVGGILERRDRLPRRRHCLPLGSDELLAEPARRPARLDIGIARCVGSTGPPRQRGCRDGSQRPAEHGAARDIKGFGGDIRFFAIGGFGQLDEHDGSVELED
ncbi:hypothetical protein D3C79_851250 [compost metagenome]